MELTGPLVAAIVAFGVVAGGLSALFGIGGGVVIVPFIVLVLDRSQHLAQGTSLLVIVPAAIAGVLAHRGRGYVSFPVAGLLALGGIPGALAGARIALAVDPDRLETFFALFLTVMGVRLVVQARRSGAATS
ncbi:MAG: sulfite exporter TauE/SafE family protein [Actinomycetota bacterium]